MTARRTPPEAYSAPGLSGPTSIVEWPIVRTPSAGRRRTRPYRHVHLEVDLEPDIVREPGFPILRQMEALIREREVVEIGDLLRLSASALHALASAGFSRVDHWEVQPGGWLPLPEPSHRGLIEPVGHMLRALRNDRWQHLANARSFAVRLSGSVAFRADVVIRRVHRERTHSVSLDLWGKVKATDVRAIASAFRERLPVLRSEVTAYSYE
jgi:hypothetical protein